MFIYLMRHAHALNLGTDGIYSDHDRRLSPKGKERSKLTGQFLRNKGIKIDTILSSPLVRAKETALIMHDALAVNKPVIQTPLLAPGGSKETLCDSLIQYGKNVLLIGHIPDLEYLCSYLLLGHHHLKINFRKTSVCFIEIQDFPPVGTGTLHWMLDPDLLGP